MSYRTANIFNNVQALRLALNDLKSALDKLRALNDLFPGLLTDPAWDQTLAGTGHEGITAAAVTDILRLTVGAASPSILAHIEANFIDDALWPFLWRRE